MQNVAEFGMLRRWHQVAWNLVCHALNKLLSSLRLIVLIESENFIDTIFCSWDKKRLCHIRGSYRLDRKILKFNQDFS